MEEFIRNTLTSQPYAEYTVEDIKHIAFEAQDTITNFSVFLRNYKEDNEIIEKITEYLDEICKDSEYIKVKENEYVDCYSYYPHIKQEKKINELEKKIEQNQEVIDNLTELIEELQIKLEEATKKKRFYFW